MGPTCPEDIDNLALLKLLLLLLFPDGVTAIALAGEADNDGEKDVVVVDEDDAEGPLLFGGGPAAVHDLFGLVGGGSRFTPGDAGSALFSLVREVNDVDGDDCDNECFCFIA